VHHPDDAGKIGVIHAARTNGSLVRNQYAEESLDQANTSPTNTNQITAASSRSKPAKNPSSKSIAVASPSKKLSERKKNRKPKWELVPWSERGASKGPLFARLAWELLQRPKSDFGKNEKGEWSEFMLRDMPASEFVAVRLIVSAMGGDLAATRQLIDLIDSAKAVETARAQAGPMVIQIVYEQPVERQTGQQKKAYEATLTRAEKMLQTVQALPAAKSEAADAGIEYTPIEPESAE
jgi:hypothetical protein